MTPQEFEKLLRDYKGNRNGFINAYLQKDNTANRSDVGKLYDTYNQNAGSSTGNSSSGGGVTSGISFEQLRSNARFPTIEEEGLKVDTMINEVIKLGSLLKTPGELGRQAVKDLFSLVKDNYSLFLQEQSALRTSINKDAGLSLEFAENYREVLSDANPPLLQLGVSFQSLSDSAVSLVQDTGRFYTLNEKSWVRAGQVGEAYTGTMGELIKMLPNLEKVGIGATNAMESIAKAGKESISLGLRAQSVTRDVNLNIERLNEFGFSKGIDGLTRMVQKSIEFRTSMEGAFRIAEKVMSPEGAIELTANLQALGGAIGDFNDPMKLMYMATNDVEGLQDALLKASGNLATYNDEQKRFELTGVNLRYAREMAAQLGVEYKEFAKGAIASAERAAAAGDLLRAGLTLDEKQTEFITNIAKMKDGKMVIDVSGSKDLMNIFKSDSVALENLDKGNAELILQYQKSLEKKTEEDLIRDQATSVTNIERYVASILAYGRKQFGPIPQEALNEIIKTTTKAVTGKEYDMKQGENVLLDSLKKGAETLKGYNASEIFTDFINDLKKETNTNVNTKSTTNTTSTQPTSPISSTPLNTNTGASQTASTTQTETTSGIKKAYDMFTQNVKDMRDSFVSYVKNMSDTNITLTNILDKLKTTFGIAQVNTQNLATQTSSITKTNNQNINTNPLVSFASYKTMNNDLITSLNNSLSEKLGQISTQKNTEGKEELVVIHKHSHEHLFKADAMMDAWSRMILRNPENFQKSDNEESYTYPYSNSVATG
jgi:hypothetical protein